MLRLPGFALLVALWGAVYGLAAWMQIGRVGDAVDFLEQLNGSTAGGSGGGG